MPKIGTIKKITTLFCLFPPRLLLRVMEDGHAFKLEALPHKSLLFLNAPNGASLKALLLGGEVAKEEEIANWEGGANTNDNDSGEHHSN